MSQRLIAIVEDEEHLRENYREALERYGFSTRGYAGRAEAQSALSGPLPDLVIIDIGLGNEPEGGFELCRTLRQRSSSLPIIFLTARDSDLDAVSGLRLGADDYLTKSISNQHLLARILALFRRIEAVREPDGKETPIRVGALELEPGTMRVRWREREVGLTVTEFWIVHCLLAHPGHVRSRERLMEAANLVVDETTITSHVKRIRRKFSAADPEFDALETVHGAGYRWHA
ncbi:MAG: response regulator [Gammaproteobacteria bacterium]|jgi:two-component system OmpR family response regulator|nr:response regulator [Gammaproteobacteria bacterium]